MRWRRKDPGPRLDTGERTLAWCAAEGGAVLAGSRDALHLIDGDTQRRIPWHEIEAADWSRDDSVLRVSEVGEWGEVRPEHRFTVSEPGLLLQLVRERVTSTVVLQRHVLVRGRRGVRVIARRATSGPREIRWFFEYDEGVDPEDEHVRRVAQAALAQAREEVGA